MQHEPRHRAVLRAQFRATKHSHTAVRLSAPSHQTEALSPSNTHSAAPAGSPSPTVRLSASMNYRSRGLVQEASDRLCPFVTGPFHQHEALKAHPHTACVRMAFLFEAE